MAGARNLQRAGVVLLAVCWPSAMAAHWLHAPPALVFALCCGAILSLALFLGEATEVIAHHLGPGPGALMTATFGNAAELIIALAALRAGKLDIVKASITGSLLVNLLFILGCSMLAGGWGRVRQTFNAKSALNGVAVMFLAVSALALPDFYLMARGEEARSHMVAMSTALSAVMLILYALSLVFSLKTHAHYFTEDEHIVEDLPWGVKTATGILLGATLLTVVIAEVLVHAVEGAAARLGMTQTFVGLIVVSVVGTAAENATALRMARKDRINLSFNIAVESSKQIALFVAPFLVFASLVAAPQPMTLEFSPLEVAGLGIGVGGVALVAIDGESNWLEGAMLLAIYAMLAVAFYHTGP